jgi:hypothetical protein
VKLKDAQVKMTLADIWLEKLLILGLDIRPSLGFTDL